MSWREWWKCSTWSTGHSDPGLDLDLNLNLNLNLNLDLDLDLDT